MSDVRRHMNLKLRTMLHNQLVIRRNGEILFSDYRIYLDHRSYNNTLYVQFIRPFTKGLNQNVIYIIYFKKK